MTIQKNFTSVFTTGTEDYCEDSSQIKTDSPRLCSVNCSKLIPVLRLSDNANKQVTISECIMVKAKLLVQTCQWAHHAANASYFFEGIQEEGVLERSYAGSGL